VRYTKYTIAIRKRIMHVRRIELLLVLVIAAIQMPFAKAAEIKYVVGSEMPYYPGDFLNEHFRPSSVYKYSTEDIDGRIVEDFRSVVDSTGQLINLPQGNEPGRTGTSAISWNQSGDIVGSSYTGSESSNGFLFRNGAITYLSEQIPYKSQGAKAINERGQIVGGNWPLQGTPYFYEDGTFVPLQVLPGYGVGRATDINESGLVVGDNRKAFGNLEGVIYVGTQPFNLTDITEGLNGRVVGEVFAITDDNRILARLSDTTTYETKVGTFWLEPLILETGDIQAIWDEAKAAVNATPIPLPDEEPSVDPAPEPGSGDGDTRVNDDNGGNDGDGGTVVVDNGDDDGFWNTPTDGVVPDDETPSTDGVTTPEPTPVPEPHSIVMWATIGSTCLIVTTIRGRKQAGQTDSKQSLPHAA
jgi:hypothetical protein